MSFLQDLPREVRGELECHNPYLDTCDSECSELLDVLLRRGYLVHPIKGGLRFDDQPHPSDFEDLSELVGIPAVCESSGAELDGGIPIQNNAGDMRLLIPRGVEALNFRQKVMSDKQRRRIRGHYWYSGRELHDPAWGFQSLERRGKWDVFIRMRFGCKVPVAALDPGVALLVKVFAWYGLGTRMSCEGHEINRADYRSLTGYEHPYILFISEVHAEWAKIVLMSTFPRTFAHVWRKEDSEAEISGLFKRLCSYGPGLIAMEESSHRQLLEVLYRMARRLMNPEWALKFRERKANITMSQIRMMSHMLEMGETADFQELWSSTAMGEYGTFARHRGGYRNDP